MIIKATAGGGGKGIRVAENEEKLISGIHTTQQEAEAAFEIQAFILKNTFKISAT